MRLETRFGLRPNFACPSEICWVVKAMNCSQCGKKRAALKRCSRCKQASYCGAECQNAAWKGYTKTCVTLDDVVEGVNAAHCRQDWRAVLKWEGRMEAMMEDWTEAVCNEILAVFADAHGRAFGSTGSKDHSLSIVQLETRRVEVLGKMRRFRDQGDALCTVANFAEPLNTSAFSTINTKRRGASSGHGRLPKLTASSR